MKMTTLLLAMAMTTMAVAQEKNQELESQVDHVQVFLQGAQVKRKGVANLDAGITRLVFTGITNQLDPNSIRVSASGNVIILSVSSKNSIQSNPKKAPIIRMLEDSLTLLRYQVEEERNNRFVLDQQESLILANKDLKGDKGLVLIDLEDALLIYKNQLGQIKKAQLESRTREVTLMTRVELMQRQLDEFRRGNQVPSYEVIVTVSSAKAARQEPLELSYFVYSAAWVPTYDIRVNDLKTPVQLHYKADIYNNTGENWNNVSMMLSSGNPNLGGVPPVLHPQSLYYTDPVTQNWDYRGNGNAPRKSEDGYYVTDVEEQKAQAPSFQQKNTSFTFTIPGRVNAAANNEPQTIDLVRYELNGIFSHFAVPKLETDAFLLTRITGWEDLSLLIGSANIYFEGTFLGKTVIDPTITADTLDISLGRDKGVVIQREKLKEFCSSNFMGSKKKEVLVYEITIRNTKKETVSINIEDQIPVSSNKEITVEINNLSGAEYDETTGKLLWKKQLAPGETLKLRIEFDVKYPKDKILQGL